MSFSCSIVFFNSLARSSFHFLSISLCGQLGQQSLQFGKFSLFFLLLIITRFGLLVEIRWSICISKSQRVCVSPSPGQILGCAYYFFAWSNFAFLHNSQWITLPTPSCQVLYSFCDNLLHSLIMWLIVSSLSLHNLYLLFCCVLSILALIWLVFVALFCVDIWKDSVFLERYLFLSHVHVFSCEMSLVCRLKRP